MEKTTKPSNSDEIIREEVRALSDPQIKQILASREQMMKENRTPTREEYLKIQTAATEKIRRIEEGTYNPVSSTETSS